MCQGYYRHSEGYTPDWEGTADFRGQIVHPQTWPEDLDYTDKNVLVIGSGATAATIIPAMAPDAKHVTMLQRSPTYFVCGRNAIEIADTLRELDIDETWIHEIVRRKILFDQAEIAKASFEHPEVVQEKLFDGIREIMGDDYDVDEHFHPHYLPWRQRIAFVPDGDLFHGLKSGKASVVTDEIERFNRKGHLGSSRATRSRPTSSSRPPASTSMLWATSTSSSTTSRSLSQRPSGGEARCSPASRTWHGCSVTFRASWTLRADMIADLVCRLLETMEERGADIVMPTISAADAEMELLPWVDPDNFNPGYLKRKMHILPRQGAHAPWQHTQDYWSEREEMATADLDDGLIYS